MKNVEEKSERNYAWAWAIVILVWIGVVFVCWLAVVETKNWSVKCSEVKVESVQRQEEMRPVALPETVENSVLVVGNNNTVHYNTWQVEKRLQAEGTGRITANAVKVLEATSAWSDTFTMADAIELSNMITVAARRHDLEIWEGFAIVHIESDFRVTAYNRGGNAYGLTEVTPPCLAEYNNNHEEKFTIEEMFDPEKNLEVGFWYFSRIIKHYSKYPEYGITLTSAETALRDAYIAYNVGVTCFRDIGRWGRNELRQGRYPCNMYGSKKGDSYDPYFRFQEKLKIWVN